MSASHRPSTSCSNSISKDSPSGGCGRVAMERSTPPVYEKKSKWGRRNYESLRGLKA
jgi:hypothetical protein